MGYTEENSELIRVSPNQRTYLNGTDFIRNRFGITLTRRSLGVPGERWRSELVVEGVPHPGQAQLGFRDEVLRTHTTGGFGRGVGPAFQTPPGSRERTRGLSSNGLEPAHSLGNLAFELVVPRLDNGDDIPASRYLTAFSKDWINFRRCRSDPFRIIRRLIYKYIETSSVA
jgi:hypothetical protein